jgi:hypothetical protein
MLAPWRGTSGSFEEPRRNDPYAQRAKTDGYYAGRQTD